MTSLCKYTLVAWRDDAGQSRDAAVRTPPKELAAQLDSSQFAQVHRSVVVNVLPVSRNHLHLFRQM
jgi:DNA-binding LytR/AlgR family response regulator